MNYFSKSNVKFGLILTALVVICLAIMEITGHDQSFASGGVFQTILQTFAPVVILIWAIWARRRALIRAGSGMTWKEGVSEGFKASLIFAIVSPFVFMLYYLMFNMEILAYVGEIYRMSSASPTKIMIVDMLIQFISATMFGLVVSMVVALFLRKKNSTANPAVPNVTNPDAAAIQPHTSL
jgi:hypothetical protein